MTSEAYDSMSVVALKDTLRERGLPISGKKADLIKRLEDADKEAANVSDPKPAVSAGHEAAAADDSAQPAEAAVQKDAQAETEEQPLDDPVAKRLERFGSAVLTADEKAKMREARFKASEPVVDASTLEARAARFGIETEEARKKKELARAKRFQMDTPEIVAEKKRAREARFKQPVPEKASVSLEELAAMIKKR
eukprot:jgi/Ulvmu1/6104/UM027_0082.1